MSKREIGLGSGPSGNLVDGRFGTVGIDTDGSCYNGGIGWYVKGMGFARCIMGDTTGSSQITAFLL
jgi:hypothetical protein